MKMLKRNMQVHLEMRLFAASAVLVVLVAVVTASAQRCGVWQGATDWTCASSVPCPTPPGGVCAVITAPVNGALAECDCTTCAMDAAGACSGTCPYTRTCVKSSVANTCTCAPVATPIPTPAPTPQAPPTPPPPCGKYNGATTTVSGTTIHLCDPPQCSTNTHQLCGLLEPLDPVVPPVCACSSCLFNADLQSCSGECPLGMLCARIAGTTTCQCAPVTPPPPPQCGEFAGDRTTWLCTPPSCASANVTIQQDNGLPPLIVTQSRQCAVVEKPAAVGLERCACTTCHYLAAEHRCNGTCALGNSCTPLRLSGSDKYVCVCRRRIHIILIAVLIFMGLAIVVLGVVGANSAGSGGGGIRIVRRGSRSN